MFLPRFLGGEAPKRQNSTKVTTFSIHRVILVVFVVLKLFVIGILHDHSLHDLQASLHARRIKRVLNMLLLNLLRLVFVLFVLHLLFKLLSLHVLELLHVRIEDHPMGGLQGEVRHHGWIGLHTFLPQWQVESLRRSLLEVELVSE